MKVHFAQPLLLVLLVLIGAMAPNAPAQTTNCQTSPSALRQWQWAARAGATNDDVAYGIARHSSGAVYVTGRFRGTATFGSITLTSSGSDDIFVAKLSASGAFIWATNAGGSGFDQGLAIAVDPSGNAYVGGETAGGSTFGSVTLSTGGGFVAKIDASGNFLWATNAGISVAGVALEASGVRLYICGSFFGIMTFGSTTLTSAGSNNIFISGLNPGSGNFLWTAHPLGQTADGANAVTVDGSGNVLVTGQFGYTSTSASGATTFGATTLNSFAGADIFVTKLNSSGTFLWATNAGGAGLDSGRAIATDGSGNVYVTGDFNNFGSGTAAFGSFTIPSAGNQNVFITKLTASGSFLWATNAGGVYYDFGRGIAVDSAGNASVCGMTYNGAFGGIMPGTLGGFDIFLTRLDTLGNFLWATNAGGSGDDSGNGIVLDPSGCGYVTGHFNSAAAGFPPLTTPLSNAGMNDAWVGKLCSLCPSNSLPTISCPSNLVVNCGSSNGATVTLSALVCDAEGDPFSVQWVVNSSGVQFTSVNTGQVPNCTNSTLTYTFPLGTSTVNINVFAGGVVVTSCTTTVTVLTDTTPPKVNCACLPSLTVTNCKAQIPNLIPYVCASDNCTPASQLLITQSPAAGTPVGPGTHGIVLTVCDQAGNCANCSTTFTVVQGQVVLTLYSGINGNTALAPGQPDANFQGLSGGFVSPPNCVVIQGSSIPGSWLASGPNSQWIGPAINGYGSPNTGTYRYQARFFLQCTNGARIAGRFATDNNGSIFLNGNNTGITSPYVGFTAWTPVNITSGFVLGNNTLDFYVYNGQGPTGLRTELLGSVNCCTNNCLQIYCPSNIVRWTCSNSLQVCFTATATNFCVAPAMPVPVNCTPPSCSTFQPGHTLVTCTASDPIGNSASCTFAVTVVPDIYPPVIHCPTNFTLYTCTNGAFAYYHVTASDDCDPHPTVVCNPPSGSFFPLGMTTVNCNSTDSCGHKTVCTFKVTVSTNIPPFTAHCGLHDNCALPTDPTFRSACLNAAYPTAQWKDFDDTASDHFVGHTFTGLPVGIVRAQLMLRMKPGSGQPNNDSINLGLILPCATPTWAWSRAINGLPGAGGTWTTNPKTTFTLDLGNLPGGGNIIPKLAADRFLDVFIQDDTVVDWMDLTVWTCPKPHHFFGLAHTALGKAELAERADDDTPNVRRLSVLNLGSSGEDGVSISLGTPSTRVFNMFYQNPQGDGTMTLTMSGYVGGQPGQPLQRTTLEFAGEEETYSFDCSPMGAKSFTLQIFDGPRLMFERRGNPSGGQTLRTKKFKYELLPYDDWHMGHYDDNGDFHAGYSTVTAPAATVFNVIGGPAVVGNAALIIPEDPKILPEALSDATVQTSGDITELNIRAETLSDARSSAAARGEGSFEPWGRYLTVANLGSSGEDGVELAFQPSESFNVIFGPIDPMDECPPECLLADATLSTHAIGSIGGAPDQILDTFTLRKSGDYLSITADFSPIGSFSQHVQVLNQGQIVADFPGHTGPAGTASDWPNSLGKLGARTPCRRGGWGSNTVFMINGAAFMGDELRVLAELSAGPLAASPPVDYLSGFSIFSSGIPHLTLIDTEVTRLASDCPPAPLHIEQDGEFVVLWWAGDSFRLQAASTLGAAGSPGVVGRWSDVAGASPVVLPATNPQRFFRLICSSPP